MSMVAVNVTATVASTNISTFMMMSRNGTMLSSPRLFALFRLLRCGEPADFRPLCCAELFLLRHRGAGLVSRRVGWDRQEVEDALHRRVQVVLDVLRARCGG